MLVQLFDDLALKSLDRIVDESRYGGNWTLNRVRNAQNMIESSLFGFMSFDTVGIEKIKILRRFRCNGIILGISRLDLLFSILFIIPAFHVSHSLLL